MADEAFFRACVEGDVAAVRAALAAHPQLVHQREPGDNALPLHFAAANGKVEIVRLLLDAGSDVHGKGDRHDGDVIGWAAGNANGTRDEIVRLLVERGAQHHIFSAIAMDDPALVRRVVAEDRSQLTRRRSPFEQGQTPLHFALVAPDNTGPANPRYAMAKLLIELGIDVNAPDGRGRTVLEMVLLTGDREAARILRAAGAREPAVTMPADIAKLLGEQARNVRKIVPMMCVADVDATVGFYQSVGFTLVARVPEEGPMGWALLSHGAVELMVQPHGSRPAPSVALWFYLTQVDELFALLRSRILSDPGVPYVFEQDLFDAHYGGRQFTIRDPNGLEIVFYAE